MFILIVAGGIRVGADPSGEMQSLMKSPIVDAYLIVRMTSDERRDGCHRTGPFQFRSTWLESLTLGESRQTNGN